MKLPKLLHGKDGYGSQSGFTIVELALACVIFPIIVIGISNAYISIRQSYSTARQLNEMYAVLSACPEIDRALEFTSLSSGTNCYPNNNFRVEDITGSASVTYSPTLSVTSTSSLPPADPLNSVPDSKVLEIHVPFLSSVSKNPPLSLRMLITRNGIGQQ